MTGEKSWPDYPDGLGENSHYQVKNAKKQVLKMTGHVNNLEMHRCPPRKVALQSFSTFSILNRDNSE
jgi:hypothetical protein